MSDQIAEVSGRVLRRPRKKSGAKAAKGAKKHRAVTLVFASKRRSSRDKSWDDDFPEFLEKLKKLMKQFKITIKKIG
jgi:hypothetical protein